MDVEEASKNGKPSRSRSYIVAGYLASAILIFAFIFLVFNAFVQFDFWKTYFYEGAFDLKKSCEVSTMISPEQNLSPEDFKFHATKSIDIPHAQLPEFEREPSANEYRNLYYRCNVTTAELGNTEELVYLHASWLFGHHSRVFVNGASKASFLGMNKPSIPLLREDLQKPQILLEIIASGKPSDERVGLQGLAPTVIATTQQQNFKIFGIETALQYVRYLINVLPLLTLSLVVVFGWVLGIRSRLVLTVLTYAMFAVARNFLVLYLDLWPWDYNLSYGFSVIFTIGVLISIFVFAFEFIHFGGRFIGELTRLNLILIPLLCVVLANFDNKTIFLRRVRDVHFILTLLGVSAIYIVTLLKIKSGSIEKHMVKPAYWLLGIFALLAISTLSDRLQLLGNVFLKQKIDVIMPFAIGGFLFYVLKLIQDRYIEERTHRLKMETDLEIAKEIQDSMEPPPPDTRFGDYVLSCYQIKHSQVAGDWMAVRNNGDGEILIVIADVTGKGIQAALVVHAIQSIWAEALSDKVIDPVTWIKKLNRTLVTLGQQKPHSATLGMLQIKSGQVNYYCMGHTPAFLVEPNERKVHSLMSRGSILGIMPNVEVEKKEFDLSALENFHLLLGTDGVFDKGSRTRPREVLAFLDELLDKGKDSLIDRDDGDDRTLFYIHNAA